MRVALPCCFRYLVFASSVSLTTPTVAETFHDWCAIHFSGSQISSGLASPVQDVDADGLSNFIEYFGGTDPWNPSEFPRLDQGPSFGTTSFAMALDRVDAVYQLTVSNDLMTWQEGGTLLSGGTLTHHSLDGFSYAMLRVARRVGFMIDSDQDGLDDFYEELLVASDSNDSINHIGEVHPADDFDGNGTSNLEELANAPEPMPGGSHAKPALIPVDELTTVLDSVPAPKADVLIIHTPLR